MAAAHANRWKLGLFVVLGLGVGFATLLWLGGSEFGKETVTAVSYLDESVQGLDVGSPLKFRGVTIGTVSKIGIAPDRRHVEVTSTVYQDQLRQLGLGDIGVSRGGGLGGFVGATLRVQLVSAGITGVKFLQVDFFDPQWYPPPELPFDTPPNYFPSVPSTLKSLEDPVMQTLNRLPSLSKNASQMLIEANRTLGAVRQVVTDLAGKDGPLYRLLARLDSSVTGLDDTIRSAQLGQTTDSVRQAAGRVGDAAAAMSVAAADVGGLTETMQEDLETLREALDSIRSLADVLERDPAALLRGRRYGPEPVEEKP